jgi:6-pyruvoyltetrahydropterin/6-carboxytetrahydropterin synthase
MDPNRPDAGDCPRADTLLVAITLTKPNSPKLSASARPWRVSGASAHRYVGESLGARRPGRGLGQLRNLLLPIQGLQWVREEIEAALGGAAAPRGLPQLHEALYKKTTIAEEMPVEPGTHLLVSKDFTFDSAHNLPRYHGKCEHLHGHTFKLRVTVKAPLDTWSGMAFDFMSLKKVVAERVVNVLDHTYLNEIIPNPSAEFISIWIWRHLSDLPLHEITVWETPTSFVTYQGPPKG